MTALPGAAAPPAPFRLIPAVERRPDVVRFAQTWAGRMTMAAVGVAILYAANSARLGRGVVGVPCDQ